MFEVRKRSILVRLGFVVATCRTIYRIKYIKRRRSHKISQFQSTFFTFFRPRQRSHRMSDRGVWPLGVTSSVRSRNVTARGHTTCPIEECDRQRSHRVSDRGMWPLDVTPSVRSRNVTAHFSVGFHLQAFIKILKFVNFDINFESKKCRFCYTWDSNRRSSLHLLITYKTKTVFDPPFSSLNCNFVNLSILNLPPNYAICCTSRQCTLKESRTVLCYDTRAFRQTAAKTWNSLPDDVRLADKLETFRSRLKTHLLL